MYGVQPNTVPMKDGQGMSTEDPRSLGNILMRKFNERYHDRSVDPQKILNRIDALKRQRQYMVEKYYWAANTMQVADVLTNKIRPILLAKKSSEGLLPPEAEKAVDIAMFGFLVDALEIWQDSVAEFEKHLAA